MSRYDAYTTDGLTLAIEREIEAMEDLSASIKAKREEKARREAEAKKTVGQRVAEEAVYAGFDCVSLSAGCRGYTFIVRSDQRSGDVRDGIRSVVARLVDKVRADTIEECAKVLDASAAEYGVTQFGVHQYSNTAVDSILRIRADHLRALK